MAIPNPNPNIADGVKSDVTTYSSNKIESLISVATELPVPAAGDAGKVLTVNELADGYELDTPVDPTSIIDDSAAAANKVYSSNKTASLITINGDTVNGTTISAPITNHVIIIFHKYIYFVRRYSDTTIELLEVNGNVLATGDGSFTFGTLTVTLSDGIITFTNSAAIQMSVISF